MERVGYWFITTTGQLVTSADDVSAISWQAHATIVLPSDVNKLNKLWSCKLIDVCLFTFCRLNFTMVRWQVKGILGRHHVGYNGEDDRFPAKSNQWNSVRKSYFIFPSFPNLRKKSGEFEVKICESLFLQELYDILMLVEVSRPHWELYASLWEVMVVFKRC